MATNDYKEPTFYRPNRAAVIPGGLGVALGQTDVTGLLPDTLQLDTNTLFYGLGALALGMFLLGGRAEPQRKLREARRHVGRRDSDDSRGRRYHGRRHN